MRRTHLCKYLAVACRNKHAAFPVQSCFDISNKCVHIIKNACFYIGLWFREFIILYKAQCWRRVEVVYVVFIINLPLFSEFRCKVTKNIWYFPTFPHKKSFSIFFSIFSTKLSTTKSVDNQSFVCVIIKVVKSGVKKCVFSINSSTYSICDDFCLNGLGVYHLYDIWRSPIFFLWNNRLLVGY